MKWLLIAMIVSWNADAITTDFALQQPGVRESNPLGQNRAVRYITSTGYPIALWHITKPLDKKWRVLVFIGVTVVHSYAAVHNHGLH